MQKISQNLPELLTEIVEDPLQLMFKKKQSSALAELIIRKIFTEAGYDGIYIEKGIVGGMLKGFVPDINKVFGTDQKQLVLFNTEKAQILSRSFKERFKDMGESAKAIIKQQKNFIKEFIRITKQLIAENKKDI